jgi:ribonuclease BN (tRNA processing enzyme)
VNPERLHFPTAGAPGDWELHLETAAAPAVVGHSVAALATAFAVPSLGVALDMGRCSALLARQDVVLLSHCHSDHIAGLVAWLSAHTRRHRDRPTTIAVPAERRSSLLAALSVWPDLDGVRRRVDLDACLVGAEDGDEIPLAGGAVARAVRAHHVVPSLAWSLHPTSAGRASIHYGGDGSILPYRDRPELLDAALALVDCTFVESGRRVAARLSGHGHLTDWMELLPNAACDCLGLIHLASYTDIRALTTTVEAQLRGHAGPPVVAWIPQPTRS